MTFSIVARDPETGDLGVAVQSKFLAVGAVVPWARAGVGAVATQAFSNLSYGPDGLALLASGLTASEATSRLVAADVDREHRQLGVVDAAGRAATHTGRGCFAWAGGRVADNVAVQGNILAGPAVVDALFITFTGHGAAFPTRLVRCLAAADAAGGDRRGRQSAALLVVREGGAYGGRGDRWIDLRVDDASDPIGELGRLLELWSLYFGRPRPEDLLPLDVDLAAELRRRLETAGFGPGRTTAVYAPMHDDAPALAEAPAIGDPRPIPTGWDHSWQAALVDWMSVENLEERVAATGWIDPGVLAHARRTVRI
jgi:uncharacterized Ntn-hydrolase superfamily protein